ncbi:MAG: hypothetical protein PHU63_00185 [Candidatus ainarchaeum sp.]|nr:hypothetical protein [Candidatus ainarchaeum sp.]
MDFQNIFVIKHQYGQKEMHELALISILIFLIPLIFGHLNTLPMQFFVGTTVNFLLVLSAFYLSGWKNLFPILLPSIAAYLTGILFGANTSFLLFFIPFIWLGNFIFVYLNKKISVGENKPYLGTIYSSIVKSFILFIPAVIIVYLKIVPELFLIAMGPMQLITALSGGFLALVFNNFRK